MTDTPDSSRTTPVVNDPADVGPIFTHDGVDWYTTEQILQRFGISPNTLQKWKRAGLRPRRPGTRSNLFRSDEIAAILDGDLR